MITISNAVLQRGTQELLEDASLMLHAGQKAGVIGRNGSGKSSLFACLKGDLALDQGSLRIPPGLQISYMRQETEESARSAVDYVIDGDAAFRKLEVALRKAEADQDDHRMANLHSEMDQMSGYTIRNRAEQLLSGLGFATAEFEKPVASFSGGWRIRLNLAAALMSPSDLLLLDEPTNHLDLEATLWLEQWLIQYSGTLLIISHDREFLDKVVKSIISIETRKLWQYRGNFSAYETQRAERLAQEKAHYDKQQVRRTEIEAFVRRFRAKASKARQAQSRLKELQRMQEIVLAHIDSPFDLRFFQPEQLPDHLMTLARVEIGFDKPLVRDINLSIQSDTRIGLLGVNGCGKSTLLRVLAGELEKLGGEISAARKLKTGYFAQHQVDVLDPDSNPLQLLLSCSPAGSEQSIRDYLGGYDFRGARIETRIENFSGGEKVRLALAMIAWQKPNVLLLDEPTNHLDLEMRHALTVALQEFPGAVVIVSHDRHLLNNTVDSFYMIDNGLFGPFDGVLSDYERKVQADNRAPLPTIRADGNVIELADARLALDSKTRRQLAAAQRKKIAPLKKELVQIEHQLQVINRKLLELNQKLSDPDIYLEGNKNRLQSLLKEQGIQKQALEQTEEKWLALHVEIEKLEQSD